MRGRRQSGGHLLHLGHRGEAQGVIYTHRTLWCNFDAVADMVALTDTDRLLDFRAISWISTQELALGASLLRGASVLLARRFSVSRYFNWLKRFGVTIGVSVPTAINMLLNGQRELDPAVLTHLRFMTSSSAPLSRASGGASRRPTASRSPRGKAPARAAGSAAATGGTAASERSVGR